MVSTREPPALCMACNRRHLASEPEHMYKLLAWSQKWLLPCQAVLRSDDAVQPSSRVSGQGISQCRAYVPLHLCRHLMLDDSLCCTYLLVKGWWSQVLTQPEVVCYHDTVGYQLR